MTKIGVSTGDAIEIIGKRSTCAIVWPLSSEDKDDAISIDGLLRRSAGVSLNDYVIVRKAEVKDAKSITLSPSGYRLSGVVKDFNAHVKSVLLDKPYTIGDFISLPIFGGSPMYFIVSSTRPKGVVIVTGRSLPSISSL